MFKAAFPYATADEELLERQYHKSLPSVKGDEVAGNVWIAPEEGECLPYFPDIYPSK